MFDFEKYFYNYKLVFGLCTICKIKHKIAHYIYNIHKEIEIYSYNVKLYNRRWTRFFCRVKKKLNEEKDHTPKQELCLLSKQPLIKDETLP